MRLGDPTPFRANSPRFLQIACRLFAFLIILQLGAPSVAHGSTAIVPDGFVTVQAAVDTYADTILIRAGVYAESVLVLPQFKPIVLMADPVASQRPALQYLKLWANHDHEGDIKVVGLRVSTPMVIWSHSVSAHFNFESCTFDAGLGHGGIWIDPDHAGAGTSLIRCMIRGEIALTTGTLTVESDTVEGGGASFMTQQASVRNCWFRGPAGLGLSHRSPIYCIVSDNVFEDCSTGIQVYDDYNSSNISIQNNVIRRSQRYGIWMEHAEYVEILGNDIRDSGVGIKANVDGNLTFRVIGNTVIGCGGNGMDLDSGDWDIEVRNNTVLRCRGSGIRVQGLEYGSVASRVISANTCAMNDGPGFDIVIDNQYYPGLRTVVSKNVGYGNGSWGLRWTSNDTPTIGCNDWFSNIAGAVSGTAPGATDMSVDPLFCDIGQDDARLRSDSPLVVGACGTIGSDSVGCDQTTEVLVALLAAETSDQGVGIHWSLGGDEVPMNVWIERSNAEPGPWQRILTDRTADGRVTVDWDRGAEPGHRYWYRLVWSTLDSQENRSLSIEVVAAPRVSTFELRRIGPNPTAGPIAIEYALPRSAAIEVTIHDLLGREVTRIENGVRSPGLHVAHWTGEVRGGRAGPGVYFVRLSWPEGQAARRILLRP
jgi:parallel beta helix pectate lyase-like protein